MRSVPGAAAGAAPSAGRKWNFRAFRRDSPGHFQRFGRKAQAFEDFAQQAHIEIGTVVERIWPAYAARAGFGPITSVSMRIHAPLTSGILTDQISGLMMPPSSRAKYGWNIPHISPRVVISRICSQYNCCPSYTHSRSISRFNRRARLRVPLHHLFDQRQRNFSIIGLIGEMPAAVDPAPGGAAILDQQRAWPANRFDHGLTQPVHRIAAEGHPRDHRVHHFLKDHRHLHGRLCKRLFGQVFLHGRGLGCGPHAPDGLHQACCGPVHSAPF
jgi:hypothetical protein